MLVLLPMYGGFYMTAYDVTLQEDNEAVMT